MRHRALLCLVARAAALARSTLQNTTVYDRLPRLECAKEDVVDKTRDVRSEPAVLFEEKLNYKHPLMRPAEGLAELDMSYSNALEGVKPDSDWGQHNDYAYYIANGYPMESISSALVLDDCTLENGCLIMWPGSHIQHRIHDANPELGA